MKGREVVLLVFIIAAGVLLTQTYRGNINWDWNWGDWDGPLFGLSHEAAAQETRTIEQPLPQELRVVNSHGDVVVEPAADGLMTISLEKKAFARTEEEARQAAQALHLTVSREGSKLVLSTNRDDFRRRRFQTNFRITAPEGLTVDIENSYGLVKTIKTGPTTVANSHGAVTAESVRGAYVCRTSYEDVNVSDAAADCRVESHHGSVTILRVKGPARVTNSYGEVRLEDAAGDVTVNGSHAEVTGRRLAGTVRVETTYRDISLAEVGPATVIGHHSGIEVSEAKGSVDITDNYGRVGLKGIQGSLTVSGRSLEISGRACAGPLISITTSYENIDLADFSGKADITASHANVSLAPARIGGDILVKGDYGEIRLIWPAGSRNPFEARTRYGKVRWNLSEKPDLNETNGLSLVKAFGAETGQPRVSLSTSYADIVIEAAGPGKT